MSSVRYRYSYMYVEKETKDNSETISVQADASLNIANSSLGERGRERAMSRFFYIAVAFLTKRMRDGPVRLDQH